MAAGIHRTCTAAEKSDGGFADGNTKRDVSMFTGTKNTLFGCVISYQHTGIFS